MPCTSGMRKGLWEDSVRAAVRDPDRFGISFHLPFVLCNFKAGLRDNIETIVVA